LAEKVKDERATGNGKFETSVAEKLYKTSLIFRDGGVNAANDIKWFFNGFG